MGLKSRETTYIRIQKITEVCIHIYIYICNINLHQVTAVILCGVRAA